MNFYDLFPNQIKTILIKNFTKAILYPKNKKHSEQKNKAPNQKIRQYIDASLIIKNNIETINYFWALYLKLSLLVNNQIKENILLNGYYIIHKNIIMTMKTKEEKEKICGFGTKNIMKIVYQNKLDYIKLLETDFMKNKISKEAFSFNSNNSQFIVYDIIENKIKKKKSIIKVGFNKQFTNYQNMKFKRKNTNNLNEENNNVLSDNENQEEENSKNINNSQKVRNFMEDNASQSSAMTKSSLSSFWNINKAQSRENQNNFTSKKFYKWQIILGALLLMLLILIIILMWKIKIKKNQISLDIDNYLDLIQFIRIFHQFSIQYLTIACVAESLGDDCKSYISALDTEIFNQTLFIMEQNNVLAEHGSVIN